jgi:Tfp pilus assembly protein PilV
MDRHRRRQGVVLTEALIAIAMLIIMLVGITFFHAVYSAKTASLQKARMQAWSGTRFDCQGTEARGAAQIAVEVPIQVRTAAGGPAQRSVTAKDSVACNLKQSQRDDTIGVLSWAVASAAQSMPGDAMKEVGGEIIHSIGEAAKDAAKALLKKINPFD